MVDRCVCCGAIIPEGTQVCINCVRRTLDSAPKAASSCPDLIKTGKILPPGPRQG